jgi:hypothetical protein
MAMHRVDRCAQIPRRKPPALVVCKTCLKMHTVKWRPDWKDQLHGFLNEHADAHHCYAFSMLVQ